jgi:AcrR family transcriptional regulator
VAEEAFAREGYAGAHLQPIAERVGVQKTALYYYFESKAALYEAVLVAMLEDFDRSVVSALESPGSAGERLVQLVDTLNDLLAERRHYSQTLIRLFVDRVPPIGDQVGRRVERVVSRLLRFYRGGVHSGEFRKLSSRHFFQSLLGMTLFHYASGEFGASVLGSEDLFTSANVTWRRHEVREILRHGVLAR